MRETDNDELTIDLAELFAVLWERACHHHSRASSGAGGIYRDTALYHPEVYVHDQHVHADEEQRIRSDHQRRSADRLPAHPGLYGTDEEPRRDGRSDPDAESGHDDR